MPNIPIRVSIVRGQVLLLRGDTATVRICRHIQIVRPGIAGLSGKPVQHPLTENQVKPIVVGPRKIPQVANGAKKLVGTNFRVDFPWFMIGRATILPLPQLQSQLILPELSAWGPRLSFCLTSPPAEGGVVPVARRRNASWNNPTRRFT